ncbi:conserved hypothetical protein [Rubrivivax sp. A210]|uniref:DUF4124 domain-containing protein n=1 Tax=Rubrivivax sp. A210 TaxID=2772301 RepID=UPI00191B28F5|nr:DUF4124 domain-containing protein [Rubrivivax sp. A210]CAD5367111.1 conserved hypothetical protein [Rubrivivax sp. A210]
MPRLPSPPAPSTPVRRRATAVLAGLVLAALAAPALAQWVWRDRDGQVNASDRPPPRDIAEKDILARPVPEARRSAPRAADAASGAASAAAPLDRELQARKRNAEQEQAARSRADEERLAQQRAENCRSARSHISALESGQRIARVNDKGEREIIDDHTRAEDLRRAREVVAADCR